MSTAMRVESEEIEVRLLVEGIFYHYGFDFRNYDVAALIPRVWGRVRAERLTTISGLQEKIMHDPACMDRFLFDLAADEGPMFRDPDFFYAFRKTVVPFLRTYPFIRIWQVGCTTGLAVYSLSILLWEEGLYEKSKIYVTDMNASALRRARDGVFPLEGMDDYSPAYLESGGRSAIANYYVVDGDTAVFHPWLKRNLVFFPHCLSTDASFNEFNVILCRNVMEVFNAALRERVFGLLHASLGRFGILGLGDTESLSDSPCENGYEPIEGFVKLYRKVA